MGSSLVGEEDRESDGGMGSDLVGEGDRERERGRSRDEKAGRKGFGLTIAVDERDRVMMAPKCHLAFTPALRWVTHSLAFEDQLEHTLSISTSTAQKSPPPTSTPPAVSTPPMASSPPVAERIGMGRSCYDVGRLG
ncbi:hypothetical protein COCNU_03G000530 [Cocos nucifera]|uniref:Uncharacterized protein n=1 Tax=Cocos nucifera TaxID=13894 RepID=A0A8K0I1S6_COCNU|nr:hypothetical protein COCNU_03G000530 [Cocos nucifera]